MRRIALAAVALLVAAAVILLIVSRLPGEQNVAGERRNSSLYVTTRDGTPIAIDVWRPSNAKAGERRPAIMAMTRYWRAEQAGWLQRLAFAVGLIDAPDLSSTVAYLNDRGFVIVRADARGTGASGGARPFEWSPAEIRDYADIARWVSRQPWSNGRVGAMGVSYSGNTAELLAGEGEPAVKAIAPLFSDFDPQLGNANPGGAYNTGFITGWGKANALLDRNDGCGLMSFPRWACFAARWWSRGVKPVDDDHAGERLARILAARAGNNVLDAIRGVEFRDDRLKGANGLTMPAVSPFGQRARIEAGRTPMLVMAGWMDAATADGALSRYLTLRNPQEVYLGAWSHGGGHDTDPFRPVDANPLPSRERQLKVVADFFNRHLRHDVAPPARRFIRYRVMGGGWRTTQSWPPLPERSATFFLSGRHALRTTAEQRAGKDAYNVRFDVGPGTATRWRTQADGADVVYGTRDLPHERYLSYLSEPFANDAEVTGTPIVIVNLRSSRRDGLLIAYLQAVAPDGRTLYLTEGVLRLANRAIARRPAPYVPLEINRSFLRSDALYPAPGSASRIELPLYATAARIPKGYRLRLSLAGAAAGQFDRVPAGGSVSWRAIRGGRDPSRLILPIMTKPSEEPQ